MLYETHWHRINAKVASHVLSLLASVEGTTVCLEIPLQSPPPPGRPSLGDCLPPQPGDRRALTREFAEGGRVRMLYAACRDVATPVVKGIDVDRWVADNPIIAH